MIPIHRIDPARALYQQMEQHLLHDAVPSAYFNHLKRNPEFRGHPFDMLYSLTGTRQSPKHHPEGSVWNHTMMVVDEAAQLKNQSGDARVFLWAALLHDIGKAPTTRIRSGKITSYDHDKAGAGLARKFLGQFSDDAAFIDGVTALIRYHMHILYVDKGLPFADIRGMRAHTDVAELALLGLCDRLGRQGSDRAEEEENIRLFLQKTKAER